MNLTQTNTTYSFYARRQSNNDPSWRLVSGEGTWREFMLDMECFRHMNYQIKSACFGGDAIN